MIYAVICIWKTDLIIRTVFHPFSIQTKTIFKGRCIFVCSLAHSEQFWAGLRRSAVPRAFERRDGAPEQRLLNFHDFLKGAKMTRFARFWRRILGTEYIILFLFVKFWDKRDQWRFKWKFQVWREVNFSLNLAIFIWFLWLFLINSILRDCYKMKNSCRI